MTHQQRGYLLILAGLAVMLGGLVWDAILHTTEHAHLVVEALFDPETPLRNPAHALIGVGLVWTVIATLGGFTQSWVEGKDRRQVRWQWLSVPLALWLGMSGAGIVALVVLAQTP